MKELHELIRDLQEDHDLKQKEAANYYSGDTYIDNVTVQDDNGIIYNIEKLKPQGNKELARYLQYLKSVEDYESSRKQSKG